MNVPFGNNTLTVIECVETRLSSGKTSVSYQLNTLYGCSWKASESQNRSNTEHDKSVTITCRIPSSGQRCPCIGDVVILGSVASAPTTAKQVQELIDKHRKKGAFRVTSVKNNAMVGFPLSHYLCSGE